MQEQTIALTVIVVGQKNALLSGALVTARPGAGAAKTNTQGRATLALHGASKYDITVKIDGQSQTVPFYATRDGSRLLEVNLAYLAQHTLTSKPAESSSAVVTRQHVAIGTGVIVVVVFFAILWRRKNATT